MAKIDVSVIMPNYNGSQHICNAIESVLSQENTTFELLIIDDNSTDNSLVLINSYKDSRIRVFALNDNLGPGLARNLGMDNALGSYIFFLDSDDLIPRRDVLSTMVSKFDYDVDSVCGNISTFNTKGVLKNSSRMPVFNMESVGEFDRDYIYSSCYYRFMFKRENIFKAEVWFPNYMRRQDPVFLINYLSKFKKIFFVPIDVYKYRVEHKKVKWDRDKIIDSIDSFQDNLLTLSKLGYQESLQEEYDNFIYYLCKVYIPWSLTNFDSKSFIYLFKKKMEFDGYGSLVKKRIFNIFIRTLYYKLRF